MLDISFLNNPDDLAQAGWGIVAPAELDPAVLEALRPLLAWRREQAGETYRELTGKNGCRPGESKTRWLARLGVAPGPPDPRKVPTFLLLLGSPEQVPHAFSAQLDVQYAVGRLYFDTPEGYARYAEGVVKAEQNDARRRAPDETRRLSILTVEHPNDQPTALMAQNLGRPLAGRLSESVPAGWQVEHITGPEATKAALSARLTGPAAPRILLTTGHGLALPAGVQRQAQLNGALLCADWPGPRTWRRPLPQDFYFSADDVPPKMDPTGQIGIHLASYSAGTPREDAILKGVISGGGVAPRPFFAQLPQALLSRGALAFVGMVDRLWDFFYPFPPETWQNVIDAGADVFLQLMRGRRLGRAVEGVNLHYAHVTTELSEALAVSPADEAAMLQLWTRRNTFRDLVVLGDPAVQITE